DRNESGWPAAHANQIHWIGGGEIPYVGHFETGNDSLNNAMTNAATKFAYMGFDVFHGLNTTYGWVNDIGTGANLRLAVDGEPPGAPGALGMAMVANRAMMDTNINTCIIDYTRAVV